MVTGVGFHSTLAFTGKGADRNRRFRIDGKAQYGGISISRRLLQLFEDGIRFGDFFWGWLFATRCG